MSARAPVLIALLLALVVVPLHAIVALREVVGVPADRLIANLERAVTNDPNDVASIVSLARAHAMAYALKDSAAPVQPLMPEGTPRGLYREPAVLPNEVRTSSSPTQDNVAARHLRDAMRYYERALTLDPRNVVAGMGYAWMLEVSGDRARAVAQYRRVAELAWAFEAKQDFIMEGGRFLTEEALGRLIPLLDPATDADEIRALAERRARLTSVPRAITPIVVPLSSESSVPASLLDPAARVSFDADGSGLRREWSWITPQGAWLVYDAFGRGRVTSALQWFGSVTFWLFWQNGYEALASLDDNADGELAGSELAHLALWHDPNSNGVSEPGEVRSVQAYGIVALSCRFEQEESSDVAAWSPDGVRFVHGETRPTFDVMLWSRHGHAH